MRHLVLIALVLGLTGQVVGGSEPDKNAPVAGFGGFPISKSLTSMWLAGPDYRARLMVYFHGPEGWHDVKWKVVTHLEKGKPAWAEFRSEKVTLHLWMDLDVGDVEVQTRKFSIIEANTFLVLHVAEPSTPQKIIPLGVFDLPSSAGEPASVLLLRANPDLVSRIKKEISGDSGR